MIDGLSTVTVKLVEVALDGLAMQQRVLANNIANANSQGFVPQRLDFESELRAATTRESHRSPDDVKDQLSRVSNAIDNGSLLRNKQGVEVQLDLEMAALNQTVLKYEALVQGLNQYGSLTAMAISGEVNK